MCFEIPFQLYMSLDDDNNVQSMAKASISFLSFSAFFSEVLVILLMIHKLQNCLPAFCFLSFIWFFFSAFRLWGHNNFLTELSPPLRENQGVTEKNREVFCTFFLRARKFFYTNCSVGITRAFYGFFFHISFFSYSDKPTQSQREREKLLFDYLLPFVMFSESK